MAQWAKSAVIAPGESQFYGVAVDRDNNVYATGFIYDNGVTEYDFGDGAKVTGRAALKNNIVMVKYNSDGIAQWAKSTVVATNDSTFLSVTADSDDNIYAIGYIYDNTAFNFGNAVTVTPSTADVNNAFIIKYNSDGIAQWAKSTASAASSSIFRNITADLDGNLYATGFVYGNDEIGFGDDVVTAGGYSDDGNALIVKYNSLGTTQWARSANLASDYYSAETDTAGNLYVAGSISGSGIFNLGNGVTVNSAGGAVIVKYSPTGIAQWVKSTTDEDGSSKFSDI